ncbi:MAG TPA: hypothetical protein DDZ80_07810 [Cyanobacteria bacterium UBA8803]|nr:hypothetical protein [Cyanobacteria bacterium UBA9273]HBL58413.1 hypothetical protein [Cyanobacteria bacterium UBA8803]
MKNSEEQVMSPIDDAIARYKVALSAVEQAQNKPSDEQVVELLVARDAVEYNQQKDAHFTGKSYALLIELDRRLKTQAEAIASNFPLTDYRESVKPPESSWWWFLEPPQPPVHKFDRFDWVWNTLTGVCLLFATSLATHTAQAFSTEGFDVLGTLSTISQGAGVALIAGGALTDKGNKVIENILSSIGIPAHFHAETTFGFSVVMLAASYGLNSNLTTVGQWYYLQGEKLQKQGDLVSALESYQRAINFNPDQPKIYVALGKVSEEMGQLTEAKSYYEKGRALNDAAAMSGLARVSIFQSLEERGWTARIDDKIERQSDFFLVAADKLAQEEDKTLRVEIAINQGILYLSKFNLENYRYDLERTNDALTEAEGSFQQAAELEKELPPETPELGKGECYLKIVAKVRQEINYKEGETLSTAPLDLANACYGKLYQTKLNPYDDTKMYYTIYTSVVSATAYSKKNQGQNP